MVPVGVSFSLLMCYSEHILRLKGLSSVQFSKEIGENNRMGNTSNIFKKIRDTKWTFHSKMGSIKDRNGMDLTEAKDIKRWQEYIEELYKKDFTTKIITMTQSLT